MKHSILFIASIFVGLIHMQAQSPIEKNWSVMVNAGANLFDGDFKNQPLNSVWPNGLIKPTIGISIEHNPSHKWGVGLEYYYIPYGAVNTIYSFNATMHSVVPYVALNVIDFLYDRNNYNTRWTFWGTVGGGLSYYNSQYYKNDVPVGVGIKKALCIVVPLGGLVEYKLSNSFGVGAKIQYRMHTKDNLEGDKAVQYKGVTNDYISVGTIFLRYKFGANKPTHILNTVSFTELGKTLEVAKKADASSDSLKNEMNRLKNTIANLQSKLMDLNASLLGLAIENQQTKKDVSSYGDLQAKLNDLNAALQSKSNENKQVKTDTAAYKSLQAKIDELNSALASMSEDKQQAPVVVANNDCCKNPLERCSFILDCQQDADKDGVPDNRDLEPNSSPNKMVDFWGRVISADAELNIASIYFDFNRTRLDNEAKTTIKAIADKLQADPDVFVEVRGYTDIVGDVTYNKALSQLRAEGVKAELVKVYKIDPYRIVANGRGVIPVPNMAFRKNRQCQFLFSK
jgi:outer membrane protein OmpA-like peptidoglycan-associated protein